MPGEPVAQFVETVRMTQSPMKDVIYQNHITKMSIRMEKAIEQGIDDNKEDILDLFPGPLAFMLRLSWKCLRRIASFLAEALIFVVLEYLADLTIEEVAEMIVKHRTARAQ